MEDLKNKLVEAEDQRLQWLDQLNLSYTNLGQLLVEIGDVEESFLNPILEFQKNCETNSQRHGELNEIGAALEELKESSKALQDQILQQKPLWNDLYSNIGSESFKLHKRGELQDPGYGPVFEKLYRLEERIKNADNDLYQLRSNVRPKGIWNRLNKSIKEKTNQGKKKIAGDSMTKQLQQIGELLLGFTFFEQSFSEILPVQAEQFLHLRDQKEEWDEKLRDYQEQEEALIGKAGVPASHITKSLKQLQHELEQFQEELDHLYLNLGRHAWENHSIPKELDAQTKELESLQTSIESAERGVEKIKTSIALEQLMKNRDDWQKKKEKKEQQIADMNKDLKAINEALKGLDKEKADFEKQIADLEG